MTEPKAYVVYWPGEEHDKLLRVYLSRTDAERFVKEKLIGPPIWPLGITELPLYPAEKARMLEFS